MTDTNPVLPPHIAETVQAITHLHAEQHRKATFAKRIVDRTTGMIGRPVFLFGLVLAVTVWVVANAVMGQGRAIDH